MLRLASVLLVLTLLTTSIIGGTFAKYTSSGSVRDTARVAKWGVEIKTSGSLYSDAYAEYVKDDTGSNLPVTWKATPTATDITVATATNSEKNIVAPGTKSYANGLSFSITGKPEVAVEVKTTITAEDIWLKKGSYGVLAPVTVNDIHSLKKVLQENTDAVYVAEDDTYKKVDSTNLSFTTDNKYYVLTNKTDLDTDYFPVAYTLSSLTGTTSTGEKTAVEIAEVLAKAIENTTTSPTSPAYKVTYTDIKHQFGANTDLASNGPKLKDEKLTWEWKFSDGKDNADTILGDLIAAKQDNTVEYKVVSVASDGKVTLLSVGNVEDDYTVKSGTGDDVVANLRTMVNITLNVTQVD